MYIHTCTYRHIYPEVTSTEVQQKPPRGTALPAKASTTDIISRVQFVQKMAFYWKCNLDLWLHNFHLQMHTLITHKKLVETLLIQAGQWVNFLEQTRLASVTGQQQNTKTLALLHRSLKALILWPFHWAISYFPTGRHPLGALLP